MQLDFFKYHLSNIPHILHEPSSVLYSSKYLLVVITVSHVTHELFRNELLSRFGS